MKELRDLLKDPKLLFGMIVVPLLMYPLMGLAINVSTEAVQNSIGTGNMAIMDLDHGQFANLTIQYFTSLPNVTVNVIPDPEPISSAITDAQHLNATTLLVIPPGFSANITEKGQVAFMTFTPLKTFATTESARAGVVSGIIGSFGSFISAYYINSADPTLNASVVMQPLRVDASSVVNGEVFGIPPSTLSSIMLGQSFGTPVALLVVTILAMQIAATAIAVEKEQKTLETLLTLPVSRFNILAAKLIGSTLVAGLGAVTTVIGFTYYMNSFSTSFSTASVAPNLSPSPIFYVVLGALIFLTLAFATSLAIVIGVFCEDVRSAQAVVGYLVIPIMIPNFMLIFSDLQSFSMPLQLALLAFPFSYATIFSKMAFVGDYTIGILGIGYLILWTAIILYIGSRLFSSEKVLTAKFSFSRRKKKAQE
jgi:ABC-2 type transport system permease protein